MEVDSPSGETRALLRKEENWKLVIASKRRYDFGSRFSPSEVRVIFRAVARTIGRSSDS
jgi:hypothetical protein